MRQAENCQNCHATSIPHLVASVTKPGHIKRQCPACGHIIGVDALVVAPLPFSVAEQPRTQGDDLPDLR